MMQRRELKQEAWVYRCAKDSSRHVQWLPLFYARVECPSSVLVQDWYEQRAMEIEASSRMVDNALELTKLAIQKGFEVSLAVVA